MHGSKSEGRCYDNYKFFRWVYARHVRSGASHEKRGERRGRDAWRRVRTAALTRVRHTTLRTRFYIYAKPICTHHQRFLNLTSNWVLRIVTKMTQPFCACEKIDCFLQKLLAIFQKIFPPQFVKWQSNFWKISTLF